MWGIKLASKTKKATSLKKRISIQFVVVAMLAIALTTVLTIIVFFSMFRKQIYEDLKSNAALVKEVILNTNLDESSYIFKNDDIRLTMVNREGVVVYDNMVDCETMENHGDRKEIMDAFEKGHGENMRHSDTQNKNTYYYAILLYPNTVLRVGKEARGLLALFYQTIPILSIGIGILFNICLVMSHLLTQHIVDPIQTIGLNVNQFEEFHSNVPYEELKPFANTIWIQHDSIAKQLKALEKSERVRQEFTANVSHELKTPLTSIIGYAELMESGMTQPEDIPRFSSEIRNSATRLLHLINDIIELSELDVTEVEVKKEDFDFYEIAQKCVNSLIIPARKHQVSLSLEGSSSMVHANKIMMEELINNLCDNSIRYNKPNGSVNVRIEREELYTKLTVSDTGIGIPKEHIHRVFERFYRVDKSRSKETGGTGLGLAIVKHIVAKHGEHLTIESEVGVGTTISVLIDNSPTELS